MKGKIGSYFTLCILVGLAYFYWEQLEDRFQLTYIHRSLTTSQAQRDNAKKDVILYKNGYSTGGIQMQISADLLDKKNAKELAEYFSQFIQVETIKEDKDIIVTTTKKTKQNVADRVYNGQGKIIKSYQEIQQGDRLYLVAPGLLFVWPFVKLGHRVYLYPKEAHNSQPVILESFTESPRTFHVHNFFNYEEADRLIQRITEIDDEFNKLQKSGVGHGSSDGKKQISPHRTSENAFDQVSETAIKIRKRVFEVLGMEKFQDDMCDGLQLLRYKQKQAYIAHTDYFDTYTTDEWNWDPTTGGSNRFATMFMYLSNVTRGGQTCFPQATMPEGIPEIYQHPKDVEESRQMGGKLFQKDSWEYDMVQKCTSKLASYPRKGHALLFYSQKPNGELDPMSLHGGCPVLDGTKWGANLWVWNKRRYGLDHDSKGDKTTAFEVIFENPSDRPVDLFWSSTLMTTIQPHKKQMYTTYTGHKWTFKDGEKIVLEFTGDAKQGSTQNVVVPLSNGKIQQQQKTVTKEDL
jgi:prolyl 4-hydroxylase